MRIFVDTNVIVSAFTARGISADLFRHIVAEHELMTGQVNLEELERVLRDRFGASSKQISGVVKQLRAGTIVPRPRAPSTIPVRDPDDRWVLASALDGGAELLVTSDHDLLDVADQVPIPIVNPRGCWERLRQPE